MQHIFAIRFPQGLLECQPVVFEELLNHVSIDLHGLNVLKYSTAYNGNLLPSLWTSPYALAIFPTLLDADTPSMGWG